MQSGDSRKSFILANMRDFFAGDISDSNVTLLLHSEALDAFLDNKNCSILCAYEDGLGEKHEVLLCNKVSKYLF